MNMLPDPDMLRIGWECKCPRCKKGNLYKPGLTLSLRDHCEDCGLDLSRNDSADGPAVFLIFIFGFLLVPLALWLEFAFGPPLWVHAVLWGVVLIILTLGCLRPIKAYIIALQYKHRATDWE